MGIDSMRVGGGRCPSLLVGGLLIACLMLICNWWTLSSENIELVRQIDDLNEQLKISVEERDQCVTLRGTLEQRYKHTEDEVASLHVRLEQLNDLKKKNDELEDSLTMCKSELDSLKKLDATKTATLETLRLEKDTINAQLDVKRDENKKLQEEVDQLKDELANLRLTCNIVPAKKSDVMQQSATTTKQQKNDTINDTGDQENTGNSQGIEWAVEDNSNQDGEATMVGNDTISGNQNVEQQQVTKASSTTNPSEQNQ